MVASVRGRVARGRIIRRRVLPNVDEASDTALQDPPWARPLELGLVDTCLSSARCKRPPRRQENLFFSLVRIISHTFVHVEF